MFVKKVNDLLSSFLLFFLSCVRRSLLIFFLLYLWSNVKRQKNSFLFIRKSNRTERNISADKMSHYFRDFEKGGATLRKSREETTVNVVIYRLNV